MSDEGDVRDEGDEGDVGDVGDEPTGAEPAPVDDATPPSEPDSGYKRRVAIVLAVLAVVGAWIGILRTDAATNESRYARETTRTAEQALRARVNEEVVQGLEVDLDAEQEALDLRAGAGGATATTGGIDRTQLARDLTFESERLDLERGALAETRVTYNNRASQYETVLTTLAVALFLVGFTLILSRRSRPPILVPGLLLSAYVIGWAVWIHQREIPRTDPATIEASAEGATALQFGDPSGAVEHYDRAVDLDGEFVPAFTGRSLAQFTAVNPDFGRTLAIVDTTSAAAEQAFADAERAVALGDGRDVAALVESGFFRFLAGDYDGALERLDAAEAVGDRSPRMAVLQASAELARGDEDAARADLRDALGGLDATSGSTRDREIAADVLTLLEWVEAAEPDQADAVASIREDAARIESSIVVGRELSGELPADATVDLVDLSLDGDELSLTLDYAGLPEDTAVAAYLYEQPAAEAPDVQAPELARFAELSGTGTVSGSTTVERACTPVALRLDVYLDGALAGSFDAPGGEASC
ncbi:MAG: hypothetical protein KDB10_15910 [Acidimicrobiales bacterium]|nr:hypothetical protein [Acidimicrobiales bacterium]